MVVSEPSETQSRILLVEDDDAVRRSIQLLLHSHGFEVRAYPSAFDLAKDPAALRCACLVADLVMPDTDAVQLLAELRKAGWAGRSILISGYLGSERDADVRAAGFDMVLAKPISDSVLVRAVAEVIGGPAAR
ncbi:MAG TPA: response regulator [Croceibacterium sp.]|nr:response regulator [Croceibacterium sp.]